MKDIVSKIKLSNWGLVFYNNTLCLIVSVIVRRAHSHLHASGHVPQPP